MKSDNISKIVLKTFSKNEVQKLKSQRDSTDNEHNKKPYNFGSSQSGEKDLIHRDLIIDYENGNTKILTSLQSETFLSNFSKLRIIDVKNYLEKVSKNSITRQELEVFLFNVRIVITGDFKFDWTEIGEKTDLVKLAEAGKKGVDLLLSDSTNAEIPGTTPTEQKVISRLETIIFQALGRVIITSFASNVYRLKKIIEIAKKCGRKILLLGSSLSRYMKAIQKVSLWKIDKSVFIDPLLEKKIDSNKLIIFCTGSQGEAKAVLSRLAHQVYPSWKIRLGDTIILTSSPIMNNRYNLEAINNKLTELGAIIYENSKEELLHASGHACQEDLKLMLTLVKPCHFMPFHGDFRMLKAHGQLAQEIGVLPSNIFICQNGEVVQTQKEARFSEKKTFSVPRQEKTSSAIHKTQFFLTSQKVPANPNYVFGSKIIPEGRWKENLCLRQQMSQFGVIVIIFFYNQVQKKFVTPCFFTYGFLNMEKNKNLVQNW
jgi:mRNA degradation ribonuclease J1/J2